MKINEETKLQFVRDYKLPIQIVKEPLFSYYLDLFEDLYQSRTKYTLLESTIEEYDSLEDFLVDSRRIRHEAIDCVINSESFKKLQNFDMEQYKTFNHYPKKTRLYSINNLNKKFVSIDLKKANFQSLLFFDNNFFNGKETYDDFLGMFTDKQYFKESKQIRQVIFGNLLPKRQKIIQKYIMDKVKNELLKLGLKEEDVEFSSPDEIVFLYDALPIYKSIFETNELKNFKFHIEEFSLAQIRDKEIFLKFGTDENGNEIRVIKKGSSKIMAEIVKVLSNKTIEKYDLAFLDEGRLSFYQEPFFQ